MESKNYVGILLVAFTAIIIGLAMFSGSGGIASQVGATQGKVTTINETLSLVPVRLAGDHINTTYRLSLAHGCPNNEGNWRLSAGTECQLSGIVVSNSSGATLTKDTDYTLYATAGSGLSACSKMNGDITFLDTNYVNQSNSNTTTVTYTWCEDGYIPNSQSGGRSVAALITIFAALAIAAVAIWLVAGSAIREYLKV